MLGFTEAAEAKDRVKQAQEGLEQEARALAGQCTQLNELRTGRARQVVADFETFINQLASTPKEYERTVHEFHVKMDELQALGEKYLKELEEQMRNTGIGASATAGLGAGIGAATAFGAPTAAMSIAMTFGTASTGTAISTLTGAAATKAALAWLGGGALAAGGGGMAGGTGLLAMAGPVGLGLAAAALVAGGVYAHVKNGNIVDEAIQLWKQLTAAKAEVKGYVKAVFGIFELTTEHTNSLRKMLDSFSAEAPSDYRLFSDRQKELLGAMHNNVLALSRLLTMKPGDLPDVAPCSPEIQEAPLLESPGNGYVPNFVFAAANSTFASASSAYATIAGISDGFLKRKAA